MGIHKGSIQLLTYDVIPSTDRFYGKDGKLKQENFVDYILENINKKKCQKIDEINYEGFYPFEEGIDFDKEIEFTRRDGLTLFRGSDGIEIRLKFVRHRGGVPEEIIENIKKIGNKKIEEKIIKQLMPKYVDVELIWLPNIKRMEIYTFDGSVISDILDQLTETFGKEFHFRQRDFEGKGIEFLTWLAYISIRYNGRIKDYFIKEHPKIVNQISKGIMKIRIEPYGKNIMDGIIGDGTESSVDRGINPTSGSILAKIKLLYSGKFKGIKFKVYKGIDEYSLYLFHSGKIQPFLKNIKKTDYKEYIERKIHYVRKIDKLVNQLYEEGKKVDFYIPQKDWLKDIQADVLQKIQRIIF